MGQSQQSLTGIYFSGVINPAEFIVAWGDEQHEVENDSKVGIGTGKSVSSVIDEDDDAGAETRPRKVEYCDEGNIEVTEGVEGAA